MRLFFLLLLCTFLHADESQTLPKKLTIGVLNNRGDDVSLYVWQESAHYLTRALPSYEFVLIPLSFEELQKGLQEHTIDFVITNPIQYAQLEHKHHISRIATLGMHYQGNYYSYYGSVLFTRASEQAIRTPEDIGSHTIGAVDANSFGGFLLARHTFPAIHTKNVTFFKTHDAVVKAVLEKKADIGIVRTSTLEKMQQEGLVQWDAIKVLHVKQHENFPFIASTELYPEWAFAKAHHTSDTLCDEVLSALIKTAISPMETLTFKWKTPLDYSQIHTILKDLKLSPYEGEPFTFKDVLLAYKYSFMGFLLILLIILFVLHHIKKLNKELLQKATLIESFNATLEEEVKERTRQLSLVNEKLKEMAHTDELTKITNRRYFFQLAQTYFATAKRHHSSLHLLSLDIDFFKTINDTYGHATGDEILKLFCKTIKGLIRESDLFGRIGGEEFCICIQNTSNEGALTLAEKLRTHIEAMRYFTQGSEPLHVSVSIGVSAYQESDKTFSQCIQRSDEALYRAQHNGRNQVCYI